MFGGNRRESNKEAKWSQKSSMVVYRGYENYDNIINKYRYNLWEANNELDIVISSLYK